MLRLRAVPCCTDHSLACVSSPGRSTRQSCIADARSNISIYKKEKLPWPLAAPLSPSICCLSALALACVPALASAAGSMSFMTMHHLQHHHTPNSPPPPSLKVIFYICVLVWIINYKNFMTFQPLAGLPFEVPNPATIRIDLNKAIYYLKIAVALVGADMGL